MTGTLYILSKRWCAEVSKGTIECNHLNGKIHLRQSNTEAAFSEQALGYCNAAGDLLARRFSFKDT